jgi:adenylate cyclase
LSYLYFLLSVVEVHDIIVGLSKSPKKSSLRAIELAEKSIEISDSPPPHRTLAVCYVRLKEYERAIAEAKKAIELGPNYADAYMILGHVLCFSDMAAEAIPVLLKAIRLNPYPPSMYYHNLAFAYFYLDNYEEAIAQAKLAIYVSPVDNMAQRVLIGCYSLLGRETEAHLQAAELLRIDPDFSVEYAEKTAAQKNKNKTKKFMDALRKAGLK